MTAELDNEQLRAAAREVLDIFDRGDTSESWHSAMRKLRSAAAIAGPTYDTEEELEPLYRTLTGSGLTRRQLFWGAVLILFWFIMDVTGFVLDHIVPAFR